MQYNHRFARSREENCYRPERPIQVPLFDESGENVEDKAKERKKKQPE